MLFNSRPIRLTAVAGLLVVLLTLAATLPGKETGAPEAETATSPEIPPAVRALSDQGLQVANRFQAPAGLTGFTARAGGRELVVYATPDGNHALVGTMVDADGRNLSREHLETHLAAPDLGKAWSRLEEAEWVATGAEDPSRVVYMFTDPYCPYCNAIWRASRPYYQDGLQIRHLLVGVIRPESSDKAAAILDAEDPAAAFRDHQSQYGQSGSPEVPEAISDDALAAVEANGKLMTDLGVTGTPAVFYQDAEGAVKRADGMPRLSRLAEIYRLPERTAQHPSLQRFR